MFQPHNILVPTDFSDASAQAFAVALQIAGEGGSRLFLLHVIGATLQQCVSDYAIDPRILDRVLSASIVHANEKLQETLARIPEGCPVKVIPDVRQGRPAEVIVATAAERRADLIVIASHGRTGLERYLIGSVAEQVTREAGCPVLLIRPPAPVRTRAGPS